MSNQTTTYPILSDYLNGLQSACNTLEAAERTYSSAKEAHESAFLPLLPQPSQEDLETIFNLCSDVGGIKKAYVYICVCLLLFSPQSLYGGKIKTSIAKAIAETLNYQYERVYIVRPNIVFWLKNYSDFYSEVCRIYGAIMQKKNDAS